MSIIKVEHIRKEYENAVPISDISFEINKGDVIAVIGPSGSGKSTLIRTVNMLDAPTSGKIYFHGECVSDKAYDRTKLRKRVGMVFQSFNLFSHKTVLENIIMAPMDLLGLTREQAEQRADKLLGEVGLYSKRNSYPDELSGGQKQRVAIARCLAMDPEVILMDEPTSSLDPTMVDEVKTIIKGLADSGKTMMIVTHEMDLAKSVATRVFYLDRGVIYEEGTPQEIFDNPQNERTVAFMKRTRNFSCDIDMSDINLPELLSALTEYGRKNGISKKLTYRIALLTEETLVGIIGGNYENVGNLSLLVEYSSGQASAKANFYFNGTEKETKTYDELSGKIFETYCRNIRFDKNDDGYDMHISFDVKPD